MSKKTWTIEETCKLIELYREEPNLWNPEHCDYRDRIKKYDSFKKMADIFKVSAAEINRKTKNIISQHRRERRNYTKLKNSDAAGNFRPKWFGYNLMGFLNNTKQIGNWQQSEDFKASDSSVSSDENEDEIPPTAKMEIQEEEEDQGQQFANNDTQTEAVDEDTSLAVPSSSRQKRIPTFNKAKRKYVRPKQTMKPALVCTNTPIVGMVKILKSMYDQQIEKRSNVDEFDVYGELVARKLRNLSSRYAQITVQAMLNKIIYDAELGKYDAPLGLSRYDEYTNNCPNTATFSDIADNEKATTYSDPSLVPMKCELDDDFP